MPDDLINKVIDDANVQRSINKVKTELQEVIKLIQQINQLGGKINLGGGRGSANNNLQQATQSTDALARAQQRLTMAQSQLGRDIAVVNERTRQQNLQNRASAQGAISYATSLNGMRSNLRQLTQAYDNYTAAQRKNKSEGASTLRQIKELTAEISKLEQATGRYSRNVGNYASAGSKFAGGARNVLAVFGVGVGLHGAKQMLDAKAETSDQLGDLQRLLKLTTGETDRLYDSFKKLGSRTSTSGLLEIAAVLERIGVNKGAIVGMTTAIDKLHVVLGKDLGDPQKIAQDLVMLENVYSKTGLVTARSLEEIGNGILTLSHAGDVTAPFLIDFTKNLGGIAKAANISLGEALGLGAGFQQLGQKAQVSGTATVQIMSRIASNTQKFSKIAGKSVEEFTKTLREKPIEALIQVAEGAQRGKPFYDLFAASFKDLETKGVRVQGAITALGSDANKFREKIELVNVALKETNNLEEQFEIKNNTLGASLDKLKKKFADLMSDPNSSIGKFFKGVIDQAALTIGYIDRLGNAFDRLTGNRRSSDISSENISKLLTGKRSLTKEEMKASGVSFLDRQYGATTSTAAEGYEAYKNAVSDKHDQQQPLIDEFGTKDVATQKKLLLELSDAYKEASDYHNKLLKDYKKTDAVVISSELGLEGISFRVKEYNKIMKKQYQPLNSEGEGVYDLGVTEEEKRRQEAAAEKAANHAAMLEKRRLKAIEDRNKFELQKLADQQKETIESEKAGYDEKLQATGMYFQLKNDIADAQFEGEKGRIQQDIGINKASQEEIATAEAKMLKERSDNRIEWSKTITKITSEQLSKEVRDITVAAAEMRQITAERGVDELAAARKLFESRTLNEEQYEALKLQISNKYTTLEIQNEIDAANQILDLQKKAGIDTTEQKAKIKALQNALDTAGIDFADKLEKKKTDLLQKQLDTRRQLEEDHAERLKSIKQEAFDFAVELGSAQFEREKNDVQNSITEVEKKSEADIAAVNNSVASEQEKANRVALINAQSTAQKEALERKQRDIDAKSAAFQKLMALLQIGITTGEAVFKIQAQAAILAATPGLQGFAGAALAQIPLVIAAGAIQAAAVAIKPIPRYFLGTDYHPGGAARINDGGKLEVLELPGGKTGIYPHMDATLNLPRGTKVHSSVDKYINAAAWSTFKPLAPVSDSLVGNKWLAGQIVESVEKNMGEVASAITSKPSERTILTAEGLKYQFAVGQDWFDYVNKYMK